MVKSSPQKGAQPSSKQLSECGWLKRLPSNNPNDASADEDHLMNMKSFWKVCHLLWTNPRLSLQAASWVEDRVGTQVAGVVNAELETRADFLASGRCDRHLCGEPPPKKRAPR